SLRQRESSHPGPAPWPGGAPDHRLARRVGKAGTRPHVPTDKSGPMECLDLHALDFKSHIFLAFSHVPSYAAWLLDADLTSTYQYERRVLKLLQWGEPTRPWRLKTPAHVLWLEDLDRAFPGAGGCGPRVPPPPIREHAPGPDRRDALGRRRPRRQRG